MRDLYEAVAGEVGRVVVGQEQMTATALAAVSLGGHVLLEGPPGVAKTLLAAALSRALGLEFRRIQFTPDMLPSDVTGNVALRGGELVFRRGPVFTNVLLADEINRTPPKTQAALLEAMQERQVSVEGRPESLPDPFLVLATQNPIEYEGTYALPEAQLDRFLVRLDVSYPDEAAELAMLGLERRGVGPGDLEAVQPVVGVETLREARAAVDATRVDEEVARYVVAVRLEATVTPRRRGRHTLQPVALRSEGPLGLGRWRHEGAGEQEVTVYPDVPAARRLAIAVRQGRFRTAGRLTRGPLGLGTEFESIRDYEPDDDVRQVNWRATERMQRPMSNQYRVEQDREVMLLIDSGRLMASPLGDRTRLDVAVDAAVAVALVADVLGDRAGTLAFDRQVRRQIAPRRAGGHAVVRTLLDLEPRAEEPDYELAFRSVEGAKRSLMMIFCDLLEETAARPLVDAVPVLSRRHAVTVASVRDPDLDHVLATAPEDRHVSAACVAAYLRAKTRGRA